MKKLLLVSLLASSTAFAADKADVAFDISKGLPSDVYITCAEAGDLAKENPSYISQLLAVMGNASASTRGLNITKTDKTDEEVIKKLTEICTADPEMLLITAVDNTIRGLAK